MRSNRNHNSYQGQAERPDLKRENARGMAAAVVAFSVWGILPLYWKLLVQVPALEILIHRIFWAAIFAAIILAGRGTLRETLTQMRHSGNLRIFLISSLLIGGNWLLYIEAVNSGHVLESSFGYFINPLMSVALGRFFLNEKLSQPQRWALASAFLGVALMTWSYGRLPWIALVLAGSFALYGLVRKKAPAGTVRGLFIESALLAPIALGYAAWLWKNGQSYFPGHSWSISGLLVGGGVMTGIPLLAFGSAVTRLPLSTVGFMQYLAPTCQFLLAVFVFHEHFDLVKLTSFGFIWLGLGVYSVDLGMRAVKRARG